MNNPHVHNWPDSTFEYCADPYCSTYIIWHNARVEADGSVVFFDGKRWQRTDVKTEVV